MIRFPLLHVILCAAFSLAATTLLAQDVSLQPPPPSNVAGAQTTNNPDSNTVFTAVEDPASFPGGDAALMHYILEKMKYPQRCLDSAYQAVIYMSFIVERDGSLSDIKAVKDYKQCPEFVEECKKIFIGMPRWNPAQMQGKAVRASFMIPVRFKLKK